MITFSARTIVRLLMLLLIAGLLMGAVLLFTPGSAPEVLPTVGADPRASQLRPVGPAVGTVSSPAADSSVTAPSPLMRLALMLLAAVVAPLLAVPVGIQVLSWRSTAAEILILLGLPITVASVTFTVLFGAMPEWAGVVCGVAAGVLCLLTNWIVLKRIDRAVHG